MTEKIAFLADVTWLIFVCLILIEVIYDMICGVIDRKNEKAEEAAAEAEDEKQFKTWMREVLDERKQDLGQERKNGSDKLEDEELWQRSEEDWQ